MKNCCVCLIVISLLLPVQALAGQAEDAAIAAGGQVRSTWGSADALSNRLANPLLTGSLPLTTLDGNTSGIAQISCPGTRTLFEILVQPGATNDLSFVSVAWDSDLDGSFDGNATLGVPVSGACANGFVSCDPGTWTNCHWYKWTFGSGVLGYQEVTPGGLGGCYCINSGCSPASFWTMKDQILRSLAGGVAGAMASANPRLAADRAEIEGTVIRYYGQNAGGCSLTQGPYANFGYSTPEDFYQQSVLLTQQSQAEVTAQAADPNSLYNLMTNSVAFTSSSRKTCQVTRDIVFNSTTCQFGETLTDQCQILDTDPACRLEKEVVYDANDVGVITYLNFSPTGLVPVTSCKSISAPRIQSCVIKNLGGAGAIPAAFQSCGANCFNLIVGQLGDNYWSGWCSVYSTLQNLYIQYPDLIQSATLVRATWDDYMQIFMNDRLVWCGPDHCSDPNVLPSGGAPCERSTSWNVYPNLDVTNYFTKEGPLSVKVRVEVAGGGEGYAYIRILLNPTSSYDICKDWWRIERTYVCEGNSTAVKPDVTRADTIAGSLAEGTGNWTFTDPVTGTGSVGINMTEGDTCIKACKLKKADESARASSAATSADYDLNPTTQTYIYRTCVDGQCPVQTGEEIVTGCQCLSEFNLAYGVMESLRQAAVDTICSDGTPKPSLLDQ